MKKAKESCAILYIIVLGMILLYTTMPSFSVRAMEIDSPNNATNNVGITFIDSDSAVSKNEDKLPETGEKSSLFIRFSGLCVLMIFGGIILINIFRNGTKKE